jgi:hypothetical protein
VNDELEMILKEAATAKLKVLSRHSLGGTEESHKDAVRIAVLRAEI